MITPTHLLIGAAVGFAFWRAAGVAPNQAALCVAPNQAALCVACSAAGALLPDIDHPKAYLRRRLGWPGGLAFGWLRHRGITHTLVALALVAVLAWRFQPVYGVAFGLGYASHLVADLMTFTGLAVLWPLYRRPVHLLPGFLRITTGSRAERVLYLFLALILIGEIAQSPGLLKSILSDLRSLLERVQWPLS